MKQKVLLSSLCIILLCGTQKLLAQNVGINSTGAAPNSSAMLDVSSTTSGFLLPTMTDVQKNAIGSPATGLLVYQTNTQPGFWYFDGTQWVYLTMNSLYNNKYQDVGTAGVVTSVVGTWVPLPGLSRTITLTGNAKVTIYTDGGVQTTSGVTSGFSIVDIAIFQNGGFLPSGGGYKRVSAINNTGLVGNIENYTVSSTVTLGPGVYTFDIRAAKNLGSNANVSGNNLSVLMGAMLIDVVYQ
ncbi:MAG TPA: hypothetical protein VFJ43_18100 [Bacteroidia bacterium]|nr:hypothetical protein [Bacteroidia bacterium]